MSNLRRSARDKPCFVRIPGVCNHNSETVVLAHLNGGGMGLKTHDLHGAFCCSNCHDMIDGRVSRSTHEYTGAELKLMHYDGIKRTQDYWLSIGLVTTR